MVTGPDAARPIVDNLVAMEIELPIPAWGFGIISFVVLLTLMVVVLSVGGGRPHS